MTSPHPRTAIGSQTWDPERFDAFYRRHERSVAGFLMRRTGRADVAADLTSEVFAAALLAWRSDTPREVNEPAWLLGIAQLGLSEQVVRKRVSRGLARLRALIGGER